MFGAVSVLGGHLGCTGMSGLMAGLVKKTYFGQRRSPPVALILQTEVGARGAGSILLLFFQSSQSTLETLRLAQRAEPLLSGTPTLVNVQGFSCCSQSLGTLFLARLSCVLSSLHVLFFLKGVSRPLPYPGRCPTCHIGRYKSQPFKLSVLIAWGLWLASR